MEDRLIEFLNKWVDNFIFNYKGKLGKGNLTDSITGRVGVSMGNLSITLYLNDYWKYVEDGRKPGKQPPISSMLELVRNVIPRPYMLPNGKSVIPTKEQLAYLIGRSIAEKGTKGKHHLGETLDEMKQSLVEGVTKILKEEIINKLIK